MNEYEDFRFEVPTKFFVLAPTATPSPASLRHYRRWARIRNGMMPTAKGTRWERRREPR